MLQKSAVNSLSARWLSWHLMRSNATVTVMLVYQFESQHLMSETFPMKGDTPMSRRLSLCPSHFLSLIIYTEIPQMT